MNTRSALWTVLIAGAAMGLLGNLPLINLVNCILCLWVWLGGALAVLLYRRFQPTGPSPSTGQGAALGALSGVVGAVIGAGVYYLTASLSTPIMNSLAQTLNIQGELPFGTQNPGSALGGMLVFLAFDIVLYPLFGALGGLITANLIKNRSAATVN
jgi:hypothetical protein